MEAASIEVPGRMIPDSSGRPIPARLRLAIFALGFLAASVGFIVNGMWKEIPWAPLIFSAELISVVLLAAYACHRLFRCATASASAVIWLLLLAYFSGLSPVLATTAFVLAALGIGSLLVPVSGSGGSGLAVLLGLAFLSGLLGWLLPFQMHYRSVYSCGLFVLIAWRWKVILPAIRVNGESWRVIVNSSPIAALVAITLLGVASTFAWMPTIQNDDMAYHMGMLSQLHDLGHYMMAAASNVWALSAWSSDVLQSIPYLVSGEDAHGALNVVWVLLTSYFLGKLTESLGFSPVLRWLCIALYASQPMLGGSLGGMQTENATTTVVVALAFIIQSRKEADRRLLLIVSMLVGLLLALKVSNLMTAVPLGLWLLWRWRKSLAWRFLPIGLLCVVAVGGSSYAYSYALTGNPVLPLFNSFFHSSYYQLKNFDNPTWTTGLSWNLVWNLVFHTSRFVEGHDGAGGFLPVALLGALLLALYDRRARPLAVTGILAFMLPLTQVQYLRYATPALGLLVPAMMLPLNDPHRSNAAIMKILLATLLVTNFIFIFNANWQARAGVLQQLVTQGSSNVITKFAPERNAAKYIDLVYGSRARILVASQKSCFGAPFGGRALVRCWYDPVLRDASAAADADGSGAKWREIFGETGINLIVLRPHDASQALVEAIRSSAGTKVYASEPVEVWELRNSIQGQLISKSGTAVVVQFKGLQQREGNTLLDASIALHCAPSKTPIVVGWRIRQVKGAPVDHFDWILCDNSGQTADRLSVENPGKPVELTVSAAPANKADLHLVLDSSNVSWRNDLISDRDLSRNLMGVVKKRNRARLQARRAKR